MHICDNTLCIMQQHCTIATMHNAMTIAIEWIILLILDSSKGIVNWWCLFKKRFKFLIEDFNQRRTFGIHEFRNCSGSDKLNSWLNLINCRHFNTKPTILGQTRPEMRALMNSFIYERSISQKEFRNTDNNNEFFFYANNANELWIA